jgi:multidrug efflux pump subunit AcrB
MSEGDLIAVASGVRGPEKSAKFAAWRNETPAIIVDIRRQPAANVIEVADAANASNGFSQTRFVSEIGERQ